MILDTTSALVAAIPGMYPRAPKRNVIVAAVYLYGVGLALGAATSLA